MFVALFAFTNVALGCGPHYYCEAGRDLCISSCNSNSCPSWENTGPIAACKANCQNTCTASWCSSTPGPGNDRTCTEPNWRYIEMHTGPNLLGGNGRSVRKVPPIKRARSELIDELLEILGTSRGIKESRTLPAPISEALDKLKTYIEGMIPTDAKLADEGIAIVVDLQNPNISMWDKAKDLYRLQEIVRQLAGGIPPSVVLDALKIIKQYYEL